MSEAQEAAAKRILVVVRNPIGGIRTYLKYVYGNLDKTRYRYTVIIADRPEASLVSQDLGGRELEVIKVTEKGSMWAWCYAVFKTLLRENVDVIHSQGTSSGIIVAAVNLIFRIPHVITFHETFDGVLMRKVSSRFHRRVVIFLFSRADVLNVVSDDAKANFLQHFREMTPYASKIIVIRNGIDVAHFGGELPEIKEPSELQGLEGNTFTIGYLGRYMPEKGFPILVDAIDILHKRGSNDSKSIKVLSLGWGGFVREYQTQIRERRLDDHFVFLEFQPDVRRILSKVDAIAIPSLREAFCYVAVEGLLAGVPIIASACIGLGETLRGTPARMVEAGSPGHLAEAIIAEMHAPSKEAALAYRVEARERFDVMRTVERLQFLFEDLCRQR